MDSRSEKVRIPRGARVGRFPVMALLQAARYYLLYGDLEKAKSFGLNRAIFYAWAKYYGPHTGHYMLKKREALPKHIREIVVELRARGEKLDKPREVVDREGKRWLILFEGNEAVPVGPRGWFEMGGQEQTPRDFDRQVASSFEAVGIPFQVAWEAALDYLKRFPREVLLSPSRFYRYVYEPVRDSFVDSVIRPYVERLGEGSGGREAGGEAEVKPRRETGGVASGGVARREAGRGAGYPRVRRLDEFLKKG